MCWLGENKEEKIEKKFNVIFHVLNFYNYMLILLTFSIGFLVWKQRENT